MTTTDLPAAANPPEVLGPFGAPVPDAEAPVTRRADSLKLFDSTVVATDVSSVRDGAAEDNGATMQ